MREVADAVIPEQTIVGGAPVHLLPPLTAALADPAANATTGRALLDPSFMQRLLSQRAQDRALYAPIDKAIGRITKALEKPIEAGMGQAWEKSGLNAYLEDNIQFQQRRDGSRPAY